MNYREIKSAERVRLRAESKTFRDVPPTSEQIKQGIIDGSQATLILDDAVRELRAALPNGQRQRVLTFMAQAEVGVTLLRQYLDSIGVTADQLNAE